MHIRAELRRNYLRIKLLYYNFPTQLIDTIVFITMQVFKYIIMYKFKLLDSEGKFIKSFVDYKSANHYRNMYNRPDWYIARYNY